MTSSTRIWSGEGLGLRREAKRRSGICWCNALEPCAACWRGYPLRTAAALSATHVGRSGAWHGTSRMTPPALENWWKSWRKGVALWTDTRLQVVQQICMQEASQVELVASRTRIVPITSLDQASGPVGGRKVDANGLSVQRGKRMTRSLGSGQTVQIDCGGVNNAPVVASPSPDDLRDVCGSFSAHTATGSDNLHLKHVFDDHDARR